MSEATEQSPILGPVIVLPEDEMRKRQLQEKLEEYKKRFKPYQAPELQMGTICKMTVLGDLFEYGFVDTQILGFDMKETYGSGFDPDKFNTACGVIEDYCLTGGKNTRGGTGLSNLDVDPNT